MVGLGGELGSVQKFSSHEQGEYPDLRERGHSFCPGLKEQQNLTNWETLRRNKKESAPIHLRLPREIVLLWFLHLTALQPSCPSPCQCLSMPGAPYPQPACSPSRRKCLSPPLTVPRQVRSRALCSPQIFLMCRCFSCSCGRLQTGPGESVCPHEKQVLASPAGKSSVRKGERALTRVSVTFSLLLCCWQVCVTQGKRYLCHALPFPLAAARGCPGQQQRGQSCHSSWLLACSERQHPQEGERTAFPPCFPSSHFSPARVPITALAPARVVSISQEPSLGLDLLLTPCKLG